MTTERRAYPRVKVRAPVELITETSESPVRAETSDVSLGGCYVNMLFPLVVGTMVEVRLRVGAAYVIAIGTVKTRDPQVGNGIEFVRMLPEDRHELKLFIDAELENDSETPPSQSESSERVQSEHKYHPGALL